MRDLYKDFNNLPLELKAKIMYSGYISHPIADIFNYILFNEIIPISYDVDKPSFVKHLTNTGWLKEAEPYVIDIDELVEFILFYHILDD